MKNEASKGAGVRDDDTDGAMLNVAAWMKVADQMKRERDALSSKLAIARAALEELAQGATCDCHEPPGHCVCYKKIAREGLEKSK